METEDHIIRMQFFVCMEELHNMTKKIRKALKEKNVMHNDYRYNRYDMKIVDNGKIVFKDSMDWCLFEKDNYSIDFYEERKRDRNQF